MAFYAAISGFNAKKWGACIGFIAAVCSASARADVAVTIDAEGYNEFFKRCDITVETQRDANIGETTVFYRSKGGEKGIQICARQDNGGGCRGELEKHTCEDITDIEVYGVSCEDTDGALVDCGAVSVKAGEGLSAQLKLLPPAAPSDMTIYATLGGFDDFFDRCGIGFMLSGQPDIGRVDLEFDVAHSGGVAECSFNLSGHGGTGISCLGEEEFTCEAVQSLNVTKVTCHDDVGETECGSVGFSTAESGLITDIR